MSWKLPAELSARINELASDLRAEADEQQSAFDERSDRWRESDQAGDVEVWIERLYELVEEIEALDHQAL